MRMTFSIVAVAVLVAGCTERGEGVFFDHIADEVRLDGIVMSEADFVSLFADPVNVDQAVTIVRNEGVEFTILGEINSGSSDFIDYTLSSQELELFDQPEGEKVEPTEE